MLELTGKLVDSYFDKVMGRLQISDELFNKGDDHIWTVTELEEARELFRENAQILDNGIEDLVRIAYNMNKATMELQKCETRFNELLKQE
jgi:hypothetical protein